jgi:dTDP-glucose 4,6-dehydratase
MKGDPITVKNGTPYRSYLYAADLAVWLWTILFKGEASHPYNVGSDQEIKISDLAQTVSETMGLGELNGGKDDMLKGVPPQSATVDSSTSQPINSSTFIAPSRYVPSVDRGRSELGLTNRVSLKDSIHRTVFFVRN